jgi:hypothetical protein
MVKGHGTMLIKAGIPAPSPENKTVIKPDEAIDLLYKEPLCSYVLCHKNAVCLLFCAGFCFFIFSTLFAFL